MKTKNIFKKNPLFQNCPNCQVGGTLRKSHPRNWKETLVDNLTSYKIYRCRQCGWRDYISTFNFSALTAKVILFYFGVVILISYIIIMILSKLIH